MKKYIRVILALLLFGALWQGISVLVKRPFLPATTDVVMALFRLAATGKLWLHMRASLFRIFWALICSSIPAIALGVAAGRSRRFNSMISPFLYLLHPLPKAAFLPIIMLVFGIGEVSKIFLVGFIIFSQIIVTMRDAARQVPDEYIDIIHSLGAGKIAVIRHVMIPALLPGFFTGSRVSLGTAIAVLFFAETFASERGLGYLIVDAWTRIAYREMYAAILTLSLLGFILFIFMDMLEQFICPWRVSKT